jgi:hypothetical protein
MSRESSLVKFIDSECADSVQLNGSFQAENLNLFNRYNCDPYGDEEEGLTSIVSSDVADLVDSDLSVLARVFLGNAKPVEFIPTRGTKEAIAESEDVNAFVQWVIQNAKNSYKTQIDWLKEIDLQQVGYVEYGIEETEKPEVKRYEGLSDIDIRSLAASFEGEKGVKSVTISKEEAEGQSDSFDIEMTIVRKTKTYFINNVPWEDMRFSRSIQTKDDADLFGKVVRKRRSELISEYDMSMDEARGVPARTTKDSETAKVNRFDGISNADLQSSSEWQNEEVEGLDVYVLFDFDDDGILERRHVIKFGSIVVENEPFNHIPFAGCSAIQMSHNIVGKSRGEISLTTQRVNTVLNREMLDNIADVNAGRYIVNDDKVNMDDLHNVRTRGSIRAKDLNAIVPEPVLYNGDKTLQVIQYMDSKHAQTTGQMQANQALTSDQLNRETATRFEGVKDSSLAKIELVARNIAELAYKDLYEGIAWFARTFQDSQVEAYVFGREMVFNPKGWQYDHNVIAKVGTGAGDSEKTLETLGGVLALMDKEIEMGSGLVDSQKKYTVYSDIIRAAGLHGVENYFNNPARPKELLQAENEKLRQATELMQQQIQALQNPLEAAERIKARAKLIEAESKKQQADQKDRLSLLEMQQDMRQFIMKTRQEGRQFDEQMIRDLTELELKYGQDVPGASV